MRRLAFGDEGLEVPVMSGTGLEVFDKTIQTTNVWLKEMARISGLTATAAITCCALFSSPCATA